MPPSSRLRRPSGLIPVPETSLIGREADVERVSALLRAREARLVTLTGPAGVGKTRLAIKVAEELRDHFAIAFVSLASIDDPGAVLAAIGQSLGVSEPPG